MPVTTIAHVIYIFCFSHVFFFFFSDFKFQANHHLADNSDDILIVILSLPLIQEGQWSVSGERMCTILVNCLED